MTRKFLTLTSALLLVAGIIGFALGRQPKAKALERSLVFEQKELETNAHGFVFVRTLVSNAGPHLLEISFIREPMILGHTPEVPVRFQLQPLTGVQQMFQLSHPVRKGLQHSPCRLTAQAQRVFTGSLSDHVSIQLYGDPPSETVRLDILK